MAGNTQSSAGYFFNIVDAGLPGLTRTNPELVNQIGEQWQTKFMRRRKTARKKISARDQLAEAECKCGHPGHVGTGLCRDEGAEQRQAQQGNPAHGVRPGLCGCNHRSADEGGDKDYGAPDI